MEEQNVPPAPQLTSRRVTQVSTAELAPIGRVDESTFRTCVHCAAQEVIWGLGHCEDCGILLYCSSYCREQDCSNHKKDGFCLGLKNMWGPREQALSDFKSNACGAASAAWFRERFGDAFDGTNHNELIEGRWSEDPFYRPVLDCYFEFDVRLARHPTLAQAVEESIFFLFYLKKRTYLADPYNLDVFIAAALLKLYREDDAVSVICYWLDWRSRGPNIDNLRDKAIENWVAHTWPYPVINDARLDDLVDRFNTFPGQLVGVLVPIEFALILLVIKMRFITVYRKRAEAVNLFLYGYNDGVGQQLRGDQRVHVLSFLVEGGHGRYFAQRNHANRLMDYIDARDPTLLRALVDRATRAQRNGNQVCFEKFLQDFSNGKPVIRTIKRTLIDRYGIGDVEDEAEPTPPTCMQKLITFYRTNEFLIQVVCAILLGRAWAWKMDVADDDSTCPWWL